MHENAAVLGIDKRRIALAGDSAGGLISSVMCQTLRDTAGAGAAGAPKVAQPAPHFLYYPWVRTNIVETHPMPNCEPMFPLHT